MKKDKKGFTLIEMIVVIAIVGILSTMLLTSVTRIRKNSIDTRRKSNLENVRGAINMYYSAKSLWPCIGDDSGNPICTGTTLWEKIMNATSSLGYISTPIPADEDGIDPPKDYDAATCTSPCQIKICSACEIDSSEGCNSSNRPTKITDSRNWYCLEVK